MSRVTGLQPVVKKRRARLLLDRALGLRCPFIRGDKNEDEVVTGCITYQSWAYCMQELSHLLGTSYSTIAGSL